MEWSIGKIRLSPVAVDDPTAEGGGAHTTTNNVFELLQADARPLVACPLTGNPAPSDPERPLVGFTWVNYWTGADPTWPELVAYVENYPTATGIPAVHATSLVGRTYASLPTLIFGPLDVSTLDSYTSTTPLNLLGAKTLSDVKGFLLHGYADASHVHLRVVFDRGGGAIDTHSWVTYPRSGQNLVALSLEREGATSRVRIALNVGASGDTGGLV